MALAGLRVGYLLASPELTREINKARLPYNINFFSQAAAMAAIDDYPLLQVAVERLVVERENMRARLRSLPGLRVYPSRAHFVLIELLDADPPARVEALYGQGSPGR